MDDACFHHAGPPVFHEGLKGWSCCSKRVSSFDDFLAIQPCTKGKHSDVELVVKKEPEFSSNGLPSVSVDAAGKETYSNTKAATSAGPVHSAPAAKSTPSPTTTVASIKSLKKVKEVEEDDAGCSVAPGTSCKRGGCGYAFKSQELSRGSGGEARCVYHPGTPMFHEVNGEWRR